MTSASADTDASRAVASPLFLLERLAHIRCYCLTVRAVDRPLVAVESTALRGSVVALTLRFEHDDTCWCLELDVGEALECSEPSVACTVSDGFAYCRLPLATLPDGNGVQPAAPAARCRTTIFWGKAGSRRWGTPVPHQPKLSAAELDHPRASEQWREQVGMYGRAAAQRREERAALEDAVLCCAGCGSGSLLRVRGARFLPDADAMHDDLLADFVQMSKSHLLGPTPLPSPSPPTPPIARDGGDDGDDAHALGPPCWIGRHSLHAPQEAPSAAHATLARAEAFAAGEGVWAPLRCAHCNATLGAQRCARIGDGAEPASEQRRLETPVPVWFDAHPATLMGAAQLLKSAVACAPAPEAAMSVEEPPPPPPPPRGPFSGYSMAALVAGRILRAAERDEGATAHAPRRFALRAAPPVLGSAARGDADTDDATEALILLLSPYVTLATNEAAAAHAATDAIKVLYTTCPATIAALGTQKDAAAAGDLHTLVLPEAEGRRAVVDALRRSSELLHPTARCVGALRVGHLPVAPTWD